MKKSEIRFSKELRDYVLSSLREPEVLKRLREETDRDPNAIMQIPLEQGQFMSFLVKVLGAKKALEIGTYTGYSTLCVALALPKDGRVVACDINDNWAGVGRKYWKEAGVEQKIDFRLGPALRTLEALIESGEAGSFDFAFIDADKGNYDQYYEKSISLLRPGGVIAIDNVLLFGSVVDPDVLDADLRSRISDADIDAMRKLNEKVRDDPRIEGVMLPIADGLTLVRKL
jgi:predicted O-methyltransferase YrrM